MLSLAQQKNIPADAAVAVRAPLLLDLDLLLLDEALLLICP
tara:strand:- start:1166 stop:1288 length:123 start_codon:yes stop_codon:yes gene_type:complete